MAIVRPEGKIPAILLGIEPATFRLVAQWLNQLRHHAPPPPYKRTITKFACQE